MGKREADADCIEYYYDQTRGARGGHGCTVYLVPCSRCGKKVERVSYGRNQNVICDACAVGESKRKAALNKALKNELTPQSETRFNKAVEELVGQEKHIGEYEKAIRAARTKAEKYGSIPEAMVAIELLRLGYRIIPQYKVGRYRIDFYAPESKFALEVDGGTFHRNNRNKEREAIIQVSLGLNVRIIHVSAELIRDNIQKLGEYIDKAFKMP